jgi:hypothetical protein
MLLADVLLSDTRILCGPLDKWLGLIISLSLSCVVDLFTQLVQFININLIYCDRRPFEMKGHINEGGEGKQ